MNSEKENPIAQHLAMNAWGEVLSADMELVYRVRRLRPAELAQAGLAIQALEGLARKGQGKQEEDESLLGNYTETPPPGHVAADPEEARRELTPAEAKTLEEMEKIAISSLRQVRRATGRKWLPLRAVRSIEAQEPMEGLVYIGAFHPADVIAMGAGALGALSEAADKAAPFPDAA